MRPQVGTPICLNLAANAPVTTGLEDLVRDPNDSLAVKLAIAATEMIVGALAVYAFARDRTTVDWVD